MTNISKNITAVGTVNLLANSSTILQFVTGLFMQAGTTTSQTDWGTLALWLMVINLAFAIVYVVLYYNNRIEKILSKDYTNTSWTEDERKLNLQRRVDALFERNYTEETVRRKYEEADLKDNIFREIDAIKAELKALHNYSNISKTDYKDNLHRLLEKLEERIDIRLKKLETKT